MRAAEFAKAMVPHHEAAIRMAGEFLAGPDADDPVLGPLAESIQRTQRGEIDILSKWSNDVPSTSPKQAKFMSAVAKSPEFAKSAGVPQKVGKEFHEADKRKRGKKGLREYLVRGSHGEAP